MNALFDSSAIFRAIKENKIDFLNGNWTLELARYELGNIVWKEYALQAKISEQESKMIIKTIKRVLGIMNVLDIAGNEEQILEISTKLKITYYDAAYTYFAKSKKLKLITEDTHLIKKASSTVEASPLDTLSIRTPV
jgi:predicted nucleic acid-binding protein